MRETVEERKREAVEERNSRREGTNTETESTIFNKLFPIKHTLTVSSMDVRDPEWFHTAFVDGATHFDCM